MAEGLVILPQPEGVFLVTIDAQPIGSVRKVEGGYRPVHDSDALFTSFQDAALHIALSMADHSQRRVHRIYDVMLSAAIMGSLVEPKESR